LPTFQNGCFVVSASETYAIIRLFTRRGKCAEIKFHFSMRMQLFFGKVRRKTLCSTSAQWSAPVPGRSNSQRAEHFK
jgi:hypothetical protein